MTTNDATMPAEHLTPAQDHVRRRRRHRESLAAPNRAAAAPMPHGARIVAHRAESARHEEQIAHATAHAPAADAITDVAGQLDKGPQA